MLLGPFERAHCAGRHRAGDQRHQSWHRRPDVWRHPRQLTGRVGKCWVSARRHRYRVLDTLASGPRGLEHDSERRTRNADIPERPLHRQRGRLGCLQHAQRQRDIRVPLVGGHRRSTEKGRRLGLGHGRDQTRQRIDHHTNPRTHPRFHEPGD